MKVGDGASVWAELPYLQSVAGDVYEWAKGQNLIDGVLATYAFDETKTGDILATDTLRIALNKIENAIRSAMSGGGEVNQNAFSVVKVGDTTLDADSKTDTLEIAAGANITLTADAAGDKLTIAAQHPAITVGADTTSTASPAHGATFDVIDGVTKDEHGHVTAVNKKTVTLPTCTDTVTRVGYAGVADDVTIGTEPASGDVLLGDAAAKTVAASIPSAPTAEQNVQLPNMQAVKAYVDGLLVANDAMVFKGTLGEGGTAEALSAAHKAGWTYRVTTAGTYAGQACEIGDLVICIADGTEASDADWTAAQTNIDGAVTAISPLTAGMLVVGGGNKTVTPLANGAEGQVLKVGATGLEWTADKDTQVADVANDTGKVLTGISDHTTPTQTEVAALKLTGYAPDAEKTGDMAATDTLGDALNKLKNTIDSKASGAGTVTSVGITPGAGIAVTGSPITGSGEITVGIDNVVTAQATGLYSIAHNAQGLITASTPVTSIPADLIANGTDTLVFYAGTASTVV